MTTTYDKRQSRLEELLRGMLPAPEPEPPPLWKFLETFSIDALLWANNELRRLGWMVDAGELPAHAFDDACLARIHEAKRLQDAGQLPPRSPPPTPPRRAVTPKSRSEPASAPEPEGTNLYPHPAPEPEPTRAPARETAPFGLPLTTPRVVDLQGRPVTFRTSHGPTIARRR